MARKTTAQHFADGYQAALRDLALSLAEGGAPRVQEWLVANLADAQYRQIATEASVERAELEAEGREEIAADDDAGAAMTAGYRVWTPVRETASGQIVGWIRPAADGASWAAMGADELDLGAHDNVMLALEAVSDDAEIAPANLTPRAAACNCCLA